MVPFRGHVFSNSGISPDPSKVIKVEDWQIPGMSRIFSAFSSWFNIKDALVQAWHYCCMSYFPDPKKVIAYDSKHFRTSQMNCFITIRSFWLLSTLPTSFITILVLYVQDKVVFYVETLPFLLKSLRYTCACSNR